MKCIVSDSHRCYENIAAEEFFMNNIDDDIFFLYINKPAIIVGKNQNTYSQINYEYVKENHIDVVRRRSGGGAVYHDLGNLNFGFIVKEDTRGRDIKETFKRFTQPLLDVLHQLGVPAQFQGRNDLVVDGKKISGNAQFYSQNKILQHGTLLFDSDLNAVGKALNVKEEKFEGKAVQSVRSRVGNIKDYLSRPITIEEFRENIIRHVLAIFPACEMYHLGDQEKKAILDLAAQKYETWEWNYGKTLPYTFQNTFKYEMGNVEIQLNTQKGRIKEIKIYGDFFGRGNISKLENRLLNIPHEFDEIKKALEGIDLDFYIHGLDKKTFIENFF